MAKLERIRGHRESGKGPAVRRRRSLAIAGAILATGLLASLAGGLLWRSDVRDQQRRSFESTAADVSATLHTMLRRDADFVGALRAVLTMEPSMSATRFDRWFSSLSGRERQSGSVGTSVVLSLPAAAAVGFQARRNADPAFRAFVGGHTLVERPRGRARTCLPAAGATVTGPIARQLAEEVQQDWCNPATLTGSTQAAPLREQAESGELLVFPIAAQGLRTTFFQAAFYRAGLPLATAAQRRTATVGWVLSSFDIPTVIATARGGHSGLDLALYHANPGDPRQLIDRIGQPAPAHAFTRRTTFQIEGAWSLLVTQARGAAIGLAPDLQALLAFLVGAVISALLSAIVLLLTRSREHALGLVRQKTGELRHQALHDALTGLPNRLLAMDRLEQMLARARRSHGPVAVLYIDLDGFKHVNDTFGHPAGDELLRAVAARLDSVFRAGDTAARLSGDEFVVLVDNGTLAAGAEPVAERLLAVLRQPYDLGPRLGRRLSLTASIGVALDVGATAEELLGSADLALYEAKAKGRDRYELFDSRMRTASQDRLTLELDLREALEREPLFLLYQPTFDLRTETMVGVEALVRWHHPTRGTIGPDEFIPIAEQSGLIVPLGRWVLGEACRQAAAWAHAGHPLGVAVNVSTRQLEADDLIDDVRGALSDSGLDPASLTLEITETALMRDADTSIRRLSQLKGLGVRIAIDDFGTGYSSLTYLRRFPADALKIDRSFIGGVATSEESTALIRTLVQLGRSLEITTLAEGIEDVAQLHTLQREHCDQGQGFLFSRPVEPEQIEDLLSRRVGTELDGASQRAAQPPSVALT